MRLFQIPMFVLSLFGLGLLSGLDTPAANADFFFGKPQNLGPTVNSVDDVHGVWVAPDGLSLYFTSNRDGGFGGYDLWVSTRPTTQDDWEPPQNAGSPPNSQYSCWEPFISEDGLSLYFNDGCGDTIIPGGYGHADVYVSTRLSIDDNWGPPINLGPPVNASDGDAMVNISPDGLSLYFTSIRSAGWFDLWMATRDSAQSNWNEPVNLGPSINTDQGEFCPEVSRDGRLLIFMRGQESPATWDLWYSTRASGQDSWCTASKLPAPIDSPYSEAWPSLSPDGNILYFCSNRPGGYGQGDIWQVPIIPNVDFNSDEMVNIADLLRLIESWGKDDPAVDMGPCPWGDGVVDEKDLEVLMSYWGQEFPSPDLIAHWRLDEAEGGVAVDSAGNSDGVLVGDPVWEPAGGKIGGALQLDGVDDCVTMEFVRDPSEGAFSVLAWVKGGAPGQVIVSQVNGANWLMAGASDGGLATELKSAGRTGKALKSAASVTDGAWHRVGFVWDGSNRILYVDDIEVARDAQTTLVGTYAGLYVGAGSTLAPGTSWSGLIDDVRIYDRAVKP